MTTSFFVYKNDEILANAKCVNVFFDAVTKNTIIIPDELRAALEVKNFQ